MNYISFTESICNISELVLKIPAWVSFQSWNIRFGLSMACVGLIYSWFAPVGDALVGAVLDMGLWWLDLIGYDEENLMYYRAGAVS